MPGHQTEPMTRTAGSSSSKTDPMTLFCGVTCTGSKLRPFPLIFFKVRINMVGFKGSEQVGWQTYGTQTKFPAFGAAAGGAILCTFHQNMSTIRNILNAGSEYQTPCRIFKTLSKLYTILTYMILYCTCKCPFTCHDRFVVKKGADLEHDDFVCFPKWGHLTLLNKCQLVVACCGSKKTTFKKNYFGFFKKNVVPRGLLFEPKPIPLKSWRCLSSLSIRSLLKSAHLWRRGSDQRSLPNWKSQIANCAAVLHLHEITTSVDVEKLWPSSTWKFYSIHHTSDILFDTVAQDGTRVNMQTFLNFNVASVTTKTHTNMHCLPLVALLLAPWNNIYLFVSFWSQLLMRTCPTTKCEIPLCKKCQGIWVGSWSIAFLIFFAQVVLIIDIGLVVCAKSAHAPAVRLLW